MRDLLADKIRKYVVQSHIEPARRQGKAEVEVKARGVLEGMGFHSDRAPAVCSALRTRRFLSENHLTLLRAEGPPKMQSVTVTYTFRLLGQPLPGGKSELESAFLKVRGIAKKAFDRLGGGEAYIRKQRESFYDPEPRR